MIYIEEGLDVPFDKAFIYEAARRSADHAEFREWISDLSLPKSSREHAMSRLATALGSKGIIRLRRTSRSQAICSPAEPWSADGSL